MHNVTPNYIHIKTNSKSISALKAIAVAKKVWVKEEIKQLHIKKDKLNKQLYEAHLELAKNTGIDITALIDNIDDRIKPQMEKKKKTQQLKLERLIHNQIPKEQIIKCTHKFYNRVVNKSDIKFETEELELLNKGLKYNLSDNYSLEDRNTLLDLESTVQKLDTDIQESVRHKIAVKFAKVSNKRKIKNLRSRRRYRERMIAKKIREKLITNKAVVSKADKGNTIVILKESEYCDKVNSFISDNKIEKLNRDPTAQYHKKINEGINRTKSLFTNDQQKRYLKTINPSAPKLKGLPKIHKQDSPIRPLVNFQTSPSYKLAKTLDKIIKSSIELKSNSTLKNSIDLIEKVRNIKIPQNASLVSFDIVNLYTNVPVQETLRLLKQNLDQTKNLSPTQIDELMNLTKLVLSQNYFEFNGDFYIQNDGLAMGSPLSSILAELFLDNIEHLHILNNNRYCDKIIYWKRYVDDIICLYKGNSRKIDVFNNFLNNLHPNLKFTQELESNSKLNYLDITISKQNNEHSFNIYRKPTYTDHVIHAQSNHPTTHKTAAFRFMINRLLNVPLSESDHNTELNTIKYIAQTNGYKPSFIDSLYRKMKNRPPIDSNTEEKSFVTIDYSSTADKIVSSVYKNASIKIAYRTNNNLSRILKLEKPISKIEKQGVYKINCGSCDSFYIGQTGRNFATRYKEHIQSISSKKPYVNNSNFAAHVIDNGHSYSQINDALQVLHVCKKSQRLDRLEEIEIYKAKKRQPDRLINIQKNFAANIIYDTLEKVAATSPNKKDSDSNT